MVADALFQYPHYSPILEVSTITTHNLIETIAATLELKTDKFLLKEIVKGYSTDK